MSDIRMIEIAALLAIIGLTVLLASAAFGISIGLGCFTPAERSGALFHTRLIIENTPDSSEVFPNS